MMVSLSYAQPKPEPRIKEPVKIKPVPPPGPIPPSDLPDLTIWIGLRGHPTIVGDRIEIPFKVTVQNIGRADAGIFKVSTEYEIVSGGRPGLLERGGIPFTVPGQANMWYPFTSAPLPSGTPPRSQVTFNGKVSFGKAFGGVKVRIRAIADSTVGDEHMPAHGRVRESNEGNNTTAWSVVDLLGLPDLVFGSADQHRIAFREYDPAWGESVEAHYLLPVKNIGQAPAGAFCVEVEYDIVSGARPGLPTHGIVGRTIFPGTVFYGRSYPDMACHLSSAPPLPPDGSKVFRISVFFPFEFEGASIRVRGKIDPDNRVRECDETNNTTPWSNVVDFPPIRR